MRLSVKRFAGWIAAGFVAVAAGGALVASAQNQTVQLNQTAPPVVSQWPRDRGDLPHDPDYILGTLPNGMRYLVLRNYTPPRQVAMRMVIQAGSMQERPGEEGVAHFLEHLAFRGTELYPDGELNRVLEGLGLQMGADHAGHIAEIKDRFVIGRRMPGLVTQRGIHRRCIDDFSGIENSCRIKQRLHLAHQAVAMLADHQRNELTAQASIAVLTAVGAFIFAH